MSRMSKKDYGATRPVVAPKLTKADQAKRLMRAVRRDLIAKKLVTPRSELGPKYKFTWHYVLDLVGPQVVYANTTGEARAQIRKSQGLTKSQRLKQIVIHREELDVDSRKLLKQAA